MEGCCPKVVLCHLWLTDHGGQDGDASKYAELSVEDKGELLEMVQDNNIVVGPMFVQAVLLRAVREASVKDMPRLLNPFHGEGDAAFDVVKPALSACEGTLSEVEYASTFLQLAVHTALSPLIAAGKDKAKETEELCKCLSSIVKEGRARDLNAVMTAAIGDLEETTDYIFTLLKQPWQADKDS